MKQVSICPAYINRFSNMKVIVLFASLLQCAVAIELITGTSFIIGALVSYYYSAGVTKVGQTFMDLTLCYTGIEIYECCGFPWVKKDVAGLINDLKHHVFGQHIVQQIVPSAVLGSISREKPTKPLVMSFHGWPGGGKNYVASFVVKNYFKEGIRSKFYHFFNARVHFPLEEEVSSYQVQLRSWISSNVTLCPHSVFVFDEVDKMPARILDGIKPFLDHHENFDGVDYRRAIFIFLSNTGANLITERYIELWRKYGKTRDQMTLHDFDNVINKGAFNEKGGLQMSDIIDHNLIDHYVPFLPLERSHVVQCIQAELDKHAFDYRSDIIEEVMKVVVFGPKPEALFSNTGCKRLSQKVAALVHQKRLKSAEL